MISLSDLDNVPPVGRLEWCGDHEPSRRRDHFVGPTARRKLSADRDF